MLAIRSYNQKFILARGGGVLPSLPSLPSLSFHIFFPYFSSCSPPRSCPSNPTKGLGGALLALLGGSGNICSQTRSNTNANVTLYLCNEIYKSKHAGLFRMYDMLPHSSLLNLFCFISGEGDLTPKIPRWLWPCRHLIIMT